METPGFSTGSAAFPPPNAHIYLHGPAAHLPCPTVVFPLSPMPRVVHSSCRVGCLSEFLALVICQLEHGNPIPRNPVSETTFPTTAGGKIQGFSFRDTPRAWFQEQPPFLLESAPSSFQSHDSHSSCPEVTGQQPYLKSEEG